MNSNHDYSRQERRTPTFLLLLFVCLLVDIWLRVSISQHPIFWFRSPLLSWFFGAIIGQFGLFCAIRLRYPSRRWFAYGGMLVITAAGNIATDWFDVIRLSDRPLLVYLLATMLLAWFCIAPVSLLRTHYQFPSDYTQLQIKHLLIFMVLFGNGLTIFPVLPQLVYLGMMVLLVALPTIIVCFVLSRTDSLHHYTTWVMVLLGFVMFLFTVSMKSGPGSAAELAFPAVQLAILGLGGSYLLIYPREPIPESKPLPEKTPPSDFE